MKKEITVNTGQFMFSGEIYYYWPQIQLAKSLIKPRFLCISYCVTKAPHTHTILLSIILTQYYWGLHCFPQTVQTYWLNKWTNFVTFVSISKHISIYDGLFVIYLKLYTLAPDCHLCFKSVLIFVINRQVMWQWCTIIFSVLLPLLAAI